MAASCLSRRSDSAPHRKYLSLLRRKIFVELRQQRRCGGGSGETRRGVRVCHLAAAAGDNWAAPSTWCLEIPLLSLAAPGPGIWAHCCHIPPQHHCRIPLYTQQVHCLYPLPASPGTGGDKTLQHAASAVTSVCMSPRPTHWHWSPQPQWNDRYPAVTVTVVPGLVTPGHHLPTTASTHTGHLNWAGR